MAKLRIALLFGGRSVEHEVSIASALSIFDALDKSKYDVTLIGIDQSGRWLLPEQSQLLAHKENPRLIKLNKQKDELTLLPSSKGNQLILHPLEHGGSTPKPFDLVFPIVHGSFGEDGTLQGFLELANVPYVGAGVLGSALGMDKDVCRKLLKEAGIPVVEYVVIKEHEFKKNEQAIIAEAKKKIGFPAFVKPANMGSSVGVNKVKSEEELAQKIQEAFQYDQKVLVERAIDARELEVSVLGNENPEASIVGEIIPQGEFYDYHSKYIDEHGAILKIPAENLPKNISDQVREIATKTFTTLECSGMARVDFFLDKKNNKIYLNELNTLPGFTNISMYPKLWEASGIPYSKLLDKLIELALDRHKKRSKLQTTFSVNSA